MPHPLLICAHPDLARSNFSSQVLTGLDRSEFFLRCLADTPPHQPFDAAVELNHVADAESIYFLFPIHWYGPPSLLVRWTEEVLLLDKKVDPKIALEAKTVRFIVSTGASKDDYHSGGANKYPIEIYLTGLSMTFRYFGAKILPPLVFYASWKLPQSEIIAIGRSLSTQSIGACT